LIHFAWPWIWVALPLPLLCWYAMKPLKMEDAALKIPFFRRVNSIEQGVRSRPGNIKIAAALLVLAWLAFLAAAAKPEWVGDPQSIPGKGRDLMVAVDFSDSMATEDMKIKDEYYSRVQVVKYLVGDFLKQRKGDRVGLVLFATHAYLYAPLTFDRDTVDKLLQEADLGMAGRATAIGDAIALAVKRLRERPEGQRTLILLTDGQNTAGELEPLQAADLAARAKVKIYTIGIGADSMVVSRGFIFQHDEVVKPSADLDEDTLKKIAAKTGGEYFRARDPQELQQIYQQIDKIEPITLDNNIYRPSKTLFYFPLAVCLAALTALLWSMRRRGTSI